jgi:hypothetical protein
MRPLRKAQKKAAAELTLCSSETGSKLCGCARHCHATKPAIPSTPARIGARVAADTHGCCAPPQEMPSRRLVVLPTNKNAPSQSMRRG